MNKPIRVTIGMAALCMAFSAMAQKPMAYPASGQSPQQQGKDDGECHVWAKQNTGIDPAVLAPPQQETGPAVGGGERVGGALLGAAGGAIIGSVTGNAGQGAAIGAVVGTMAGGHRARKSQEAQNQQAQAQHQQQMNTFYRAYGACMEGRGYTIK
jgi:hypothetical protein